LNRKQEKLDCANEKFGCAISFSDTFDERAKRFSHGLIELSNRRATQERSNSYLIAYLIKS
jgi:hypothetical protein